MFQIGIVALLLIARGLLGSPIDAECPQAFAAGATGVYLRVIDTKGLPVSKVTGLKAYRTGGRTPLAWGQSGIIKGTAICFPEAPPGSYSVSVTAEDSVEQSGRKLQGVVTLRSGEQRREYLAVVAPMLPRQRGPLPLLARFRVTPKPQWASRARGTLWVSVYPVVGDPNSSVPSPARTGAIVSDEGEFAFNPALSEGRYLIALFLDAALLATREIVVGKEIANSSIPMEVSWPVAVPGAKDPTQANGLCPKARNETEVTLRVMGFDGSPAVSVESAVLTSEDGTRFLGQLHTKQSNCIAFQEVRDKFVVVQVKGARMARDSRPYTWSSSHSVWGLRDLLVSPGTLAAGRPAEDETDARALTFRVRPVPESTDGNVWVNLMPLFSPHFVSQYGSPRQISLGNLVSEKGIATIVGIDFRQRTYLVSIVHNGRTLQTQLVRPTDDINPVIQLSPRVWGATSQPR